MPLEVISGESWFSGRSIFLESLLSRGKNKYKRYSGLPLRYAGGKSLGVGYILDYLPDDITKLVSPFIGGASVEIACANELDINVIGYDIFDILANYWDVQLNNAELLGNRLLEWCPDKLTYDYIKSELKEIWDGVKSAISELELAAMYWFNHNLSYGPGFLGWMSKIYECPERYKRLVSKVKNFKCPNLSVYQGDFESSILKHKDDFLYCDPPYYLDDGNMFKGMYPQRNFPVHHNGFKHEVLRDMLYEHNKRFIVSYNDCETIREWYSDFEIMEVQWQYTMGQGETRIGKNRIENGASHVKKSHELLIVKR